jgi:hypothetical protein
MKVNAVLLTLFILIAPAAAGGQQTGLKQPPKAPVAKAGKGPVKSQTGESFHLAPSLDAPSQFNLIVTNGDESVISGIFTAEQVQAIYAVLEEARKFAFSEEAVGGREPLTTRLSSEGVPGFAIDVTKFDDQSQFFITIKTSVGRATVDGGTVKRSEKKEEGFFFEILFNVKSQIPRPAQSDRE